MSRALRFRDVVDELRLRRIGHAHNARISIIYGRQLPLGFALSSKQLRRLAAKCTEFADEIEGKK